jgi:hypothetical protein
VATASISGVVSSEIRAFPLISKGKHSQAELNRALVFAVGARRDNTAAIALLIKADAELLGKSDKVRISVLA